MPWRSFTRTERSRRVAACPVLALLSDTLEPRRAAGKSTLNRLEHGLKGGASRDHKPEVDKAALATVFLDLYVAAHPCRLRP